MDIIKPKALKPGDKIGIVAPSGIVWAKGLEAGISVFKNMGSDVKLGSHIYKTFEDYSAGTLEQRVEDFENMIKDPGIKAISCAEGGYAAISVLSTLKPEIISAFKANPLVLIGYSDFSLFLGASFCLGIAALHAPNSVGLYSHNKETQDSLKKALMGKAQLQYGKEFFTKVLIKGKAEGHFLPTNLETLIRLFGTKFDPLEKFDGPIILGLEEVYEDKSTLIRMMEQIAFHKNFDKVKGIVLGRFLIGEEIEYPKWGRRITLPDIFISLLKNKKIPVAEFPCFGHMEEEKRSFKLFLKKSRKKKNIFADTFLTFPSGIKVTLDANPDNPSLTFYEQAVSE